MIPGRCSRFLEEYSTNRLSKSGYMDVTSETLHSLIGIVYQLSIMAVVVDSIMFWRCFAASGAEQSAIVE